MEKRLDYYTEAYVIAARVPNGKKMYFSYDFDNNYFVWVFSAFDANLYNTVSEAQAHIDVIQKDQDIWPFIKSVWLEKLTTVPVPQFTPIELP